MSGRIVCFGEVLLRLGAPGRGPLEQAVRFDRHVGGAEANVAVSLARFGHHASMVGVLPDNALGDAALGELRRHAVDTAGIARRAGRMGLYFLETGAGLRPSRVLYDRAGSAFAVAPPDTYDWSALLRDAGWLHVSGVTPALGQGTADAALAAVRAARAAGVSVSFDGNFRPALWAAWDGRPGEILAQLVAEADLAFADHRDIDVVLGASPDGAGDAASAEARMHAAAARAFDAFPHLQRIVSTRRTQHSVDHHGLGAMLVRRDGVTVVLPDQVVDPIVDRIGAGDAFAAGFLHGRVSGLDDADALRFALAAGCLKHSIPGDFNTAGVADVQALLRQDALDVRR